MDLSWGPNVPENKASGQPSPPTNANSSTHSHRRKYRISNSDLSVSPTGLPEIEASSQPWLDVWPPPPASSAAWTKSSRHDGEQMDQFKACGLCRLRNVKA